MSDLRMMSPRSATSRVPSAVLSTGKCAVHCRETHNSAKALIAQVRASIRIGRFEAALEDCSTLLAKTPEHIQGRFLKGVCLDHLGRSQEAVEEFSLVLKQDPSHANATLSRAAALIKLGQATAALEGFVHGLELDEQRNWLNSHRKSYSTSTYCSKSSSASSSISELPSALSEVASAKSYAQAVNTPNPVEEMKALSEQEWYLKGCAAWRSGEHEEAVQCFSAVLDLNEADFRALLHRGLALESLNRLGKALEDYSKATALDPNSALAYHRRALVLARLNRPQDALTDFAIAISLEDRAVLHHTRGQLYYSIGLKDLAVQDYSRTLELDYLYAKVRFHRGICYEEMGKRREAVADYENAIVLNGDLEACERWLSLAKSDTQREKLRRKMQHSAIWRYMEGLDFEAKGELQQALECFSAAIAAQEDQGELWLARGRTRLALGELDQALSDCKEAEDRGGNVHYTRGLVYLGLQLYANAIEDLRQATASIQALTALGYAYAKGNMHLDAIKTYTRALLEAPSNPVLLHNRGNCYQRILKHTEVTTPQAISDFSQEISLQPSALAYFSRGLSYELQGARSKALADYSKSLELSS